MIRMKSSWMLMRIWRSLDLTMPLLRNSRRTLTWATPPTSTPSNSISRRPSIKKTTMRARVTPSARQIPNSTSPPITKPVTPNGEQRSENKTKRKRTRLLLWRPFSSTGTPKSRRRRMTKTGRSLSIRMLRKEIKVVPRAWEETSCNSKTSSIRIT